MWTFGKKAVVLVAILSMVGCLNIDTDDDNDNDDTPVSSSPGSVTLTDTQQASESSTAPTSARSDVPSTYSFTSRFAEGESSVAYSGQIFRHLLIEGIKDLLGNLTGRIDSNEITPITGDIKDSLNGFYQFDSSVSGELALPITTTPATKQSTYNDVSSGKDLQGKIAGNDAAGQHKDWSTEFKGWSAADATSPDGLVQFFFDEVDQLAANRAQGQVPSDPDGQSISKVFVTDTGRDYQQLIQKFLLMAITFSQGADDYLDNDTDGKGLLTDHVQDGDKTYSKLEHQWDEGYGYFGAARDYNHHTDDEIAGKGGRAEYSSGYYDTNQDGMIDLLSEYHFGNSVNAAKRDRGSSDEAPTDFTKATFDALLAGRNILSKSDEELSTEDRNKLLAQRDIIVENWEKAVAATVVHYINNVLYHMGRFNESDYSFLNHAKHWSELKGFALGLQFSRFSPLSDADFQSFHQKVGDEPVLPTADAATIDQYRQDLRDARALLQQAYDFDATNIGNDLGTSGWTSFGNNQ